VLLALLDMRTDATRTRMNASGCKDSMSMMRVHSGANPGVRARISGVAKIHRMVSLKCPHSLYQSQC
jgi:hypothetical protein